MTTCIDVAFVRHGDAEHNRLYREIGVSAYRQVAMSRLTRRGVEQAKNLGDLYSENPPDLVAVSPLWRTLETAKIAFGERIPTIALDCLLEYPQHDHICNRRTSIRRINASFDYVDLTNLPSVSPWGRDHLQKRISDMWRWLGAREEKRIVVVTHQSFIRRALSLDCPIDHCSPIRFTSRYPFR